MQLFKKEISLKQAAEISGYAQDYLGFLIRNGEMKGVKKGGIWFTTEGEVKRYIIAQKNLHKNSTKNSSIKDVFGRQFSANALIFTLVIFIGLSSFGSYFLGSQENNTNSIHTENLLSNISESLADGWSTFTFGILNNTEKSLNANKQFSVSLQNKMTRGFTSVGNRALLAYNKISSNNFSAPQSSLTASVGDSLLGASNGIQSGWGVFINGIIDSAENGVADTKKLATSLWSGILSAPNNIVSDWNSFLVILSEPKIITVPVTLPRSLVTTTATPKQTPPIQTPSVPLSGETNPSPTGSGPSVSRPTAITNITQQQRDIYINQYDPSILPRLQGVELALLNNINHNTNQTDRVYDSIIKSINSSSDNITEEGILNNTTIRSPRISNGTLSGTTTIGLVEAPGTLTINEPTTLNNNITQVGAYTLTTGTGAISLNGDTTLADGKTFSQIGAGSFSTGTGAVSINGPTTISGQTIFTHRPTLAHLFSTWPTGTSNISDSTIYINLTSSVPNGNLIGASVADVVKFVVDAEGNIYGNSVILTGSVTSGSTTVASLSVLDNTTLGDAGTDIVTIHGVTTLDNTFSQTGANTFSTGSGAVSLNGNTTITGSNTLTTGTGATTVNSTTWTFANDTNFALTGGVNGLSFDTDTLSIDSLNHRIGIGTTAPASTFEIASSKTINFNSSPVSNLTLGSNMAGGNYNINNLGRIALGNNASSNYVELLVGEASTVLDANSDWYGINVNKTYNSTSSLSLVMLGAHIQMLK